MRIRVVNTEYTQHYQMLTDAPCTPVHKYAGVWARNLCVRQGADPQATRRRGSARIGDDALHCIASSSRLDLDVPDAPSLAA